MDFFAMAMHKSNVRGAVQESAKRFVVFLKRSHFQGAVRGVAGVNLIVSNAPKGGHYYPDSHVCWVHCCLLWWTQ